jgi:hypothetical protein
MMAGLKTRSAGEDKLERRERERARESEGEREREGEIIYYKYDISSFYYGHMNGRYRAGRPFGARRYRSDRPRKGLDPGAFKINTRHTPAAQAGACGSQDTN